ncbi:MAG: outer membrane protein assembly factor BamB [Rhodothermales bacterium]|jgi:outer membrane protein assembly factor BamB
MKPLSLILIAIFAILQTACNTPSPVIVEEVEPQVAVATPPPATATPTTRSPSMLGPTNAIPAAKAKPTAKIAQAAVSKPKPKPKAPPAKSDSLTWGGNGHRNMVSTATGLSTAYEAGDYKDDSEDVDMSLTKDVKWVVKLGSQSYGTPNIFKNRILLGTNNAIPRDPKLTGDRSVVLCLDEETGAYKWQLAVPKLGTGKVSDWEYLGICAAPSFDPDGKHAYVVTNRCELLCIDINGLADGNDGPFKDEAKYLAGGKGSIEPGPTDGDIIWLYDLREELGIFPHNITSSSTLVQGDTVIICTSNGVDWSHTNIPNPNAPILAVFDKKTGELLAEEASGVSKNILHGAWSSPAFATIDGKEQIILGGPDGWMYSFGTKPVEDEEGFMILPLNWKADGNPDGYRFRDGKPVKYAGADGPCEFICSPVVYKNRVYAAIGQDPEHGEGPGNMLCFDPTKTGDVTKTGGILWQHVINRNISTAAIADDLVYVADFSGYVYCFDANDGTLYWQHETFSHIWGSCLAVDGKVYVGNEDGDLFCFKQGKEKELLHTSNLIAPIYTSPVAANGTLFVQTHTHLFAIEKK